MVTSHYVTNLKAALLNGHQVLHYWLSATEELVVQYEAAPTDGLHCSVTTEEISGLMVPIGVFIFLVLVGAAAEEVSSTSFTQQA
jgi:hypothetical protein